MKQPTMDRISRLQERFQFLSDDQARDLLCFSYWIGTREKNYLGDALQAYMEEEMDKLLAIDEKSIKKMVAKFVKIHMDQKTWLTSD